MNLHTFDLEATDSTEGKLPSELQATIRAYKTYMNETKTTDPTFGRNSLWIIDRQWRQEGSIIVRARRVALEHEDINYDRLSRDEKIKRIARIYSMRVATLNSMERRFGLSVDLALARIRNESQYQRSLAIHKHSAVDDSAILKSFNKAFAIWPDNHSLTFQLGEYFRYSWNFPRAIECLRNVASSSPNGDMRRHAAIRLALTLYQATTHAAVIELTSSEPSRLAMLKEAEALIQNVGEHREFAQEVALLRAHLALELDEEVNWSAIDHIFELLVGRIDGFPNVMIENLDQLIAESELNVPSQLDDIMREQRTNREVLGLMGSLYLRRSEKRLRPDPLIDIEHAYALFNACSLLERSWYRQEFAITSFRRGWAILCGARLTQSVDPLPQGSSDLKRSQLDLAASRLMSAADRSVGAFRELGLQYAKEAQKLYHELQRK